MARKSDDPCTKHTVLLYEEDVARLREHYPGIGASVIIRKLIRKHLNEVDPKPDTTQFKVKL